MLEINKALIHSYFIALTGITLHSLMLFYSRAKWLPSKWSFEIRLGNGYSKGQPVHTIRWSLYFKGQRSVGNNWYASDRQSYGSRDGRFWFYHHEWFSYKRHGQDKMECLHLCKRRPANNKCGLIKHQLPSPEDLVAYFPELVKICAHITMEKDITILLHNTGIHLPVVEIDATDKFRINLYITYSVFSKPRKGEVSCGNSIH